ncbi:hypothetical protein KJS94_15300 [Flavihumibacter rivuli]|uniref:hypothetical protein n=1 Tax=Flavihumibacter rivuli TaxID=2838156 RepID=UPI001BDDE997|nr:hypothetical protein [Flavihumibacter rivuli]ULQ56014.1 hypothetical protein KJS94_15300 [Flavihumibacter rivuli]
MKQLFALKFLPLLLLIIAAMSCNKEPNVDPRPGTPGGQDTKGVIRFSLAALPGVTQSLTNLAAVISLTDGQGREVVNARRMPLVAENGYRTDTLKLEEGNYSVTRFLVVDETGKVLFVVPIANSPKAALVSTPLPFVFGVAKKSETTHPLQVAKVEKSDRASDFGYPAGSFNNEPLPPYVEISVHAKIKVGDIVYDSIPVKYSLIGWYPNNQTDGQTGELMPGRNQLTLATSMVKYELSVTRFGVTDKIVLDPKNLLEGTVYVLGGAVEARKLKNEVVQRWDGRQYIAVAKNEYSYDQAGRLTNINYLRKDANNVAYLDAKKVLEYGSGSKASFVKQFDRNNQLTSRLAVEYNNEGFVRRMEASSNGVETIVNVGYTGRADLPGTSGNYEASLQMTYSNNAPAMSYKVLFQGGNAVRDEALRGSSTETGNYGYDFNINPYAHLNLPDLFLANNSRHNRTSMEKVYNGSYPEQEVYYVDFTYDAQGYPVSVVKDYRNVRTGEFLFREKTLFYY